MAVLLLGLAIAAGAFVQGSIGFGMAVVAAPFVVLLAPDLMPVALLVTSVTLPVVQLVHGPREIAWAPLGWALLGRALLTPLGVWVVTRFSADHIAVLVGVLILLTVAVSVSRFTVDARPRNAFGAGLVAGVSGTAASIGGPFLALVLQHEAPARLRATLSAFFLLGSSMALGGLAAAGHLPGHAIWAGLAWVPFLLLGYALAAPARRFLDAGRLRTGVLAFCAVAGVAVVVRAVL